MMMMILNHGEKNEKFMKKIRKNGEKIECYAKKKNKTHIICTLVIRKKSVESDEDDAYLLM